MLAGRYEIVGELGRGGMARVHLARQLDLDRYVALKQLLALQREDAEIVARFVRESRLAGALNHPSIVTVFDFFEHDGTPYIAMEYVRRGSLRPWVGRIGLAQVGGVLEGVLAGLAHAHAHGVVHRDLKPENLMITDEGRVKLTDFGIAKALDSGTTAFQTATGATLGTPSYMAPEQAMGEGIGTWTDLYAVGVIAYELLSGAPPFSQREPMAVLFAHLQQEPPPLTGVPPEIAAWVHALLAKQPEERPESARVAWDDLEEHLLEHLGPRWRRSARIEGEPDAPGRVTPSQRPLTPAQFTSDSWETVAGGDDETTERADPDTAGEVAAAGAPPDTAGSTPAPPGAAPSPSVGAPPDPPDAAPPPPVSATPDPPGAGSSPSTGATPDPPDAAPPSPVGATPDPPGAAPPPPVGATPDPPGAAPSPSAGATPDPPDAAPPPPATPDAVPAPTAAVSTPPPAAGAPRRRARRTGALVVAGVGVVAVVAVGLVLALGGGDGDPAGGGEAAASAAGDGPVPLGDDWVRAVHVISYDPEGYAKPAFTDAVRRAKHNGATHVVLHPILTTPGETSPELESKPDAPTDENLVVGLETVKREGLEAVVQPYVEPADSYAGAYDPDDRDAFFDAYAERVATYADLAGQHGASGFVAGSVFSLLDGPEHSDRWTAILDDARDRCSCQVIYQAEGVEGGERVQFWDASDAIAIAQFAALTDEPSTDPAVLAGAWTPVKTRLEALNRTWDKPVLLSELGYQSKADQATSGAYAASGEPSEEAQAALYEAAFRAFAGAPWFAGIAWYELNGDGAPPEPDDFSFAGKQAEAVMRAWHTAGTN